MARVAGARVAGARGRPSRAPAEHDPADGAVAERAPVEPTPAELVVVGRIGRPQGLRGEVTVEVRTDAPQDRFAVGAVLATDPSERGPLTVVNSREQGGRLVLSLAGVEDRAAAEALRETLLQVDLASLSEPEDDDVFHDAALRGLTAQLADGVMLGEVTDVLHLPHGDVLAIRRADGGTEALVPFVRAMVPEVDLASRTLIVTPPPGLLALSDPAQPGDVTNDGDPPNPLD